MLGRVKRSRTTWSALLLLVPLVLLSGCFGLFHSMSHRHKAARAIFWTEAVALGLSYAIDADNEGDVLFTQEGAAFLTVALGCEIYDLWGSLLKAPVEDCGEYSAHAVVTPAGASLVFRF